MRPDANPLHDPQNPFDGMKTRLHEGKEAEARQAQPQSSQDHHGHGAVPIQQAPDHGTGDHGCDQVHAHEESNHRGLSALEPHVEWIQRVVRKDERHHEIEREAEREGFREQRAACHGIHREKRDLQCTIFLLPAPFLRPRASAPYFATITGLLTSLAPVMTDDLLGSLDLPDDLPYGIHTERARRALRMAERPVRMELIHALVVVKSACAQANAEGGSLDPRIAAAIDTAAEEVLSGRWDHAFVTDALQGGAGTSTNMNVNEVLARRASALLGEPVDPLAHVNLHQSTNDTYPTALRMAAMEGIRILEQAVIALQEACQAKEREFSGIVKLGRTQLRDAVPTTLGRSFGAFSSALSRDRWRIFKCLERLRTVNIGGTAIGTGLTAPRAYIFRITEILRDRTGLSLARAENLVDATQNQDALVEVSGILKAHATTLTKLARDLRLMTSGPKGGLGEIELPPIQAGSSIMPGKINPVIPEMVQQACMRVFAHDLEIGMAASSGELELNPFLPLAADALLSMLSLLTHANDALAHLCVPGITARPDRCAAQVDLATETAAALIPDIGHDNALLLARTMRERGTGVKETAVALGLLRPEQVDTLLSPERITRLGR